MNFIHGTNAKYNAEYLTHLHNCQLECNDYYPNMLLIIQAEEQAYWMAEMGVICKQWTESQEWWQQNPQDYQVLHLWN